MIIVSVHTTCPSLGALLTLSIGAADTPVVITVLNSYSGQSSDCLCSIIDIKFISPSICLSVCLCAYLHILFLACLLGTHYLGLSDFLSLSAPTYSIFPHSSFLPLSLSLFLSLFLPLSRSASLSISLPLPSILLTQDGLSVLRDFFFQTLCSLPLVLLSVRTCGMIRACRMYVCLAVCLLPLINFFCQRCLKSNKLTGNF